MMRASLLDYFWNKKLSVFKYFDSVEEYLKVTIFSGY